MLTKPSERHGFNSVSSKSSPAHKPRQNLFYTGITNNMMRAERITQYDAGILCLFELLCELSKYDNRPHFHLAEPESRSVSASSN